MDVSNERDVMETDWLIQSQYSDGEFILTVHGDGSEIYCRTFDHKEIELGRDCYLSAVSAMSMGEDVMASIWLAEGHQ